jgi:hypothetical protein
VLSRGVAVVFSEIVDGFIASNEALKPVTAEKAWRMGRDCAINGVSGKNCLLRLFVTPELAQAWREGWTGGRQSRE